MQRINKYIFVKNNNIMTISKKSKINKTTRKTRNTNTDEQVNKIDVVDADEPVKAKVKPKIYLPKLESTTESTKVKINTGVILYFD